MHELQKQGPTKTVTQQSIKRPVAAAALVATLLVPVLFIIVLQRASLNRQLKTGDPVPVVTLTELGADPISLARLASGKMVLLFFSVDCPRCQREMANFDRLAKLFTNELTFLAISSTGAQKTKKFLDSSHATVRTLLDLEGKARWSFGVLEVPALFLIGPSGLVERSFSGEGSFETRVQQIKAFAGQSEGSTGISH